MCLYDAQGFLSCKKNIKDSQSSIGKANFEFFINSNEANDTPPSISCYKAKSTKACGSCDDVIKAYKSQGLPYNTNDFTQCQQKCYGAKNTDDCITCGDVINAFKAKNMQYDSRNFPQCKSCYGAKKTDDCHSCQDVIDAFNLKEWTYNTNNFDQCK